MPKKVKNRLVEVKKSLYKDIAYLLTTAKKLYAIDKGLSILYVWLAFSYKKALNIELSKPLRFSFCRKCLVPWIRNKTFRLVKKKGFWVYKCLSCGYERAYKPVKAFKELPHTADLKIRVEGRDEKELLRNVMNALLFYLSKPSSSSFYRRATSLIEVKAESLEELIVESLNEVIREVESKGILPESIKLLSFSKNKGYCVKIKISGEKRNFYSFIKAATYHQFVLKRLKKKIVCEVVFDV